MATRITELEVLEIMDNNLTEAQILPYILSANVFVTQALSDKGLDDSLLKEIERWLSAHMAALTKDRVIKKAGAGGAEVEYAGHWGEGLNATQYGQVAINLDTSKTLQNIANMKKSAWVYSVPGV